MIDPDLRGWAAVADTMLWTRPPTSTYLAHGEYGQWFAGGTMNLSANCVDRHLAERGDQPALHWEGEPGDRRTLTYRELHAEVTAMARALRELGVGRGDRIALHLGYLPETVVAMLACARLGAPFAVVPVPMPVDALADRLAELRPKVLLTQDGAWRHGTIIPTKARADEALAAGGGVEHTVVVRRTGLDVAWYEGDLWLHELVSKPRFEVEPAPALPAEHPLVLVSLANRRSRPVVVAHGTANLLASSMAIHRYGISPGGVFWFAGDISWLGTQAHGVLGPLAWGDTALIFEGTIDVPDHRRLWDLLQRYAVATMVTAPSLLRRVRNWTDAQPPNPADHRLRRVVTMYEPLDPTLLSWVLERVTGVPDSVADAWGQIELGGVVTVDRPVDVASMPDAGLVVVDASGAEVPDGTVGELALCRPWAGTMRALDGDDDALDHWRRRPGLYATGDRVIRRPATGTQPPRLELLGRIDPLVNVSGQLVSLTEVHDVLLDHPHVAAAEVVTMVDQRQGRAVAVCVQPVPGVEAGPMLAAGLADAVRETLGGLAQPRGVLFIDRFGDELDDGARRRALEVAVASATQLPATLTWEQVLAAAQL